jgi:hypothetical protein
VATAARRIVATSKGGGRPSRQSHPERLAFYQCPFMLPLEVVVPGGSLSTALIATPYWRDASRRVSWQAATATAVPCCDRTATALVHWLGTAGGGGGEADRFRRRRMQNLLIIFGSLSFLYSAYFILSTFRLVIRPFIMLLFGFVIRPFSYRYHLNS